MTQQEINKILELHKAWLNGDKNGVRADLSRAGLSGADLRRADLRGANLRGADLDYSAFPLWCGGLDVHIDDRQAVQLLYHLVRNVLYSRNTSDELKKLLSQKEIVDKANEFHRVDECRKIEVEETENDKKL